MSKKEPSEEYSAFDTMMGKLLTVKKSDIVERHNAHKAKSAANPNRRGPKPKAKPTADA